MWVVRNAVHVGMSPMEDSGHVIILAVISCQVVIRLHAVIIMHALALQSYASAENSTHSQAKLGIAWSCDSRLHLALRECTANPTP